jgi:hypothetical protein
MMTMLMAAMLTAPSTPSAPARRLNPHASELFERDPVLAAWAIRRFDRNGDGWLTLHEADAALVAFREIADTDRDGRVSVREYAQTKALMAERSAAPAETAASAP